MFGVDQVRAQDAVLSWQSNEFKLEGVPYVGLTKVKFSQKRERKKIWGMIKAGIPMAKTAGKYTPDKIALTVLQDTYAMMQAQLAVLGLGSHGDAAFTISFSAFELGIIPVTIVATGCTIEEEDDDMQEGIDENTVQLTVDPMLILRNGIPLFSVIRSLA